jgi:phosphoglycolate phosphatase
MAVSDSSMLAMKQRLGALPMGSFFVDLDGTIIDPKSGMIGAFRKALRENGHHHLASADLDWVIGPPVISSFAKLLPEPEQAAVAFKYYRSYYRPDGLLFDFSLYPGMIAAVSDLHSMGQLFICTMKPAILAEPILAKLGISARLFGADLHGAIKSKAQLLDQAMNELAINPSESVVIGDRGSDMAAAISTGMLALGVTWGYGNADELSDAGAHALCHSPADLARTASDMLQAGPCFS